MIKISTLDARSKAAQRYSYLKKIKKLLLILLLPIFVRCNNEKKNDSPSGMQKLYDAVKKNTDTTLTVDDKQIIENIKVGFDDPIAFTSTNNTAIPLILNQKFVDKGILENRYYNIIVISPYDTAGIMVFDTSGVIRKIKTFEKRIEINMDNDYYENDERIYSKDFNSLIFIEKQEFGTKGKGNFVLYVYDLKNKQLKQLSPSGFNLVKWFPLDGKSSIIMTCQCDDNIDGKYDGKDDERIFLADVRKGSSSLEKKIDLLKLKKIKKTLD